MAINFPDINQNNPSTSLPWADGDNFLDITTGLEYFWFAPVWKREVSATGATDTKYVEILGDHMTGSLGVGGIKSSPNINVGSNGSLFVADIVTIGDYQPSDGSSIRLSTGSLGGQLSLRVGAAYPDQTCFNIIGSDGNTYFELDNSGGIITNGDYSIEPIGTNGFTLKLYTDGRGYFSNTVTATRFIGDGSALTGMITESGGTISGDVNLEGNLFFENDDNQIEFGDFGSSPSPAGGMTLRRRLVQGDSTSTGNEFLIFNSKTTENAITICLLYTSDAADE